MFELLTEHQFWTAVVIYWIFSAAVSSMPNPAGNGSSGYLWLYRFLHTIAGNITTAFREAAHYRAGASRGSKIPGLKTFTLLLVALLAAATSACAVRYTRTCGAPHYRRISNLTTLSFWTPRHFPGRNCMLQLLEARSL